MREGVDCRGRRGLGDGSEWRGGLGVVAVLRWMLVECVVRWVGRGSRRVWRRRRLVDRGRALDGVAVARGVGRRRLRVGHRGSRGVGARRWACATVKRARLTGLAQEGGGGEASLGGVGRVTEDLEEDVGGRVAPGAGLKGVEVVEPRDDVRPGEEGEKGEEVGRVLGLMLSLEGGLRGGLGDEGEEVFVALQEAGEEGRVGLGEWREGRHTESVRHSGGQVNRNLYGIETTGVSGYGGCGCDGLDEAG